MAQVIEHAHEQDQIEALREMSDLIDRHLPELYVVSQNLGGERRLGEVAGVGVDTDATGRAAALHRHRVAAAVGAACEHAEAAESGRNGGGARAPLETRRE